MAKNSNPPPPKMPADVAKLAEELVRAGHFPSVEDVLRAGVEAVAEPLPADWNDFMRYRFAAGRAAFERGDVTRTTPKAFIDGIKAELDLK
jgi:Arc/MetJ-type ribon-helix-helix transcriptional regulator